MKIIFLDIDGVLNNQFTAERFKIDDSYYVGIDKDLLQKLFLLQKNTDADIVISSSWRSSPPHLEEIKRNGIEFIGMTPDYGDIERRGEEIKEWLVKNPNVEKYAIIDDNQWMLLEQIHNFFKTDSLYGLTDEIAENIKRYLLD